MASQGAVTISMKARRIQQMKRFEKELSKLQRRIEQVSNPAYIISLK
jgi:hypothetical protein